MCRLLRTLLARAANAGRANGRQNRSYTTTAIAQNALPSAASTETVQVSFGTLRGSLPHGGTCRGGMPRAFFVTATLNGVTHQLPVTHNGGINTIELYSGSLNQLVFPLHPTSPSTQSNLVLELYACQEGCFGRVKQAFLIGFASIRLDDVVDGEKRTVMAEFRTPAVSPRGCGRRRRRNRMLGANVMLGHMPLQISVGGVADTKGSAPHYKEEMRVNEDIVIPEEHPPAAIYGPDGTAWVGKA